MGTDTWKLDPYKTNIQPFQNDKTKGAEMFMKGNEMNPVAASAEMAMQRRLSVKHDTKIDKVDKTVNEIHKLILGQPQYKLPGMQDKLTAQGETLEQIKTQQTKIIAIMIAIPSICAIIFSLIALIK